MPSTLNLGTSSLIQKNVSDLTAFLNINPGEVFLSWEDYLE